MLAFDVLRGLMANPEIAQSLCYDHLIQFSCLASDLILCNKDGLGLTSDKRPIRFLESLLPQELHPHLDVLWKSTFHVRPGWYISPLKISIWTWCTATAPRWPDPSLCSVQICITSYQQRLPPSLPEQRQIWNRHSFGIFVQHRWMPQHSTFSLLLSQSKFVDWKICL